MICYIVHRFNVVAFIHSTTAQVLCYVTLSYVMLYCVMSRSVTKYLLQASHNFLTLVLGTNNGLPSSLPTTGNIFSATCSWFCLQLFGNRNMQELSKEFEIPPSEYKHIKKISFDQTFTTNQFMIQAWFRHFSKLFPKNQDIFSRPNHLYGLL